MTEVPQSIEPFWTRRRLYQGLLTLIFVLAWLAPILWVGLTHRDVPRAGRYLNNLYRVACLFTERVPSWSNYYVRIRLQGDTEWIDLPLTAFSRMKPFGHTTRLHRVISSARRNRAGDDVQRQLAAWIKRRYERDHPGSRPVAEIRLIGVRYPVGSPSMGHPEGRWMIPPLDDTPKNWRRTLKTWRFSSPRQFEADR